jgi:23S rRNA (cytidine1920-2'-O)/16S rRNA (cytidine1409-2'-O)-methyltransferase
LLKGGAAQVVGVDVGQGQLHPRLRSDPRVVCVEKCNARELTAGSLAQASGQAVEPFDLIVGDLSFISQTLVWPAIVPLLNPGGAMLMLVKPQFELQPDHIGKGGLVKDASSYTLVQQRMRQACADQGLTLRDYFESPITGGDGNREFFVWACQ